MKNKHEIQERISYWNKELIAINNNLDMLFTIMPRIELKDQLVAVKELNRDTDRKETVGQLIKELEWVLE
jgi:hypothetical protein